MWLDIIREKQITFEEFTQKVGKGKIILKMFKFNKIEKFRNT